MGPETKGPFMCCLYVFVLVFRCYDSCPNGTFFGRDCNYMCHCVNDEQCDDVTGDCKSGCAVDWMGPGCQYRNIVQMSQHHVTASASHNKQEAKYAVDDNLISCFDTGSNTRNKSRWQLTLNKKHYIRGLTFLTKDDYIDQFNNFKIIVLTDKKREHCIRRTTGNYNNTKFDIMCDTPIFGNAIRIVLPYTNSRLVLCDVRIYGGRNIAIGKSSNASKLASDDFNYIVNGVDKEKSWSECTRLETNQWWEINLEGHYLIQGYSIHVYDIRYEKGVRVQVQIPRNDTWKSIGHYETRPPYEDVFTPIEVTRIRLIRDKIWRRNLYLCEVQIWAECADDFCGLSCSMPCHCQLEKPLSYKNRLTGTCENGCKLGWTGDGKLCNKECQVGTNGDNCAKGCSGHCANGTACDTTNGHCQLGCEAGWQSSRCNEECKKGTYGPDCTNQCSAHCSGNNMCYRINGTCIEGCKDGWDGTRCDQECPDGSFGRMCTGNCSGHCLNGALCNKMNGSCGGGCTPGWKGSLCETECARGTYGLACKKMCSENCVDSEPCKPTDGHCQNGCEAGWTGSTCQEECPDGSFGHMCTKNCSGHCLDGNICYNTNGSCAGGCTPGWKGSLCETECPDGSYGRMCTGNCSGHCLQGNICYKTNGSCAGGCTPGWKGSLCETECDAGTYGQNCLSNCSTKCMAGSCKFTDGHCDRGCTDGWKGNNCEQACEAGTFGPACVNVCSENCVDVRSCTTSDGFCLGGCKPGWLGEHCGTACPFGFYGNQCNTTCKNCDGYNITCHHVDGSCNSRCSHGNQDGRCLNSNLPPTGTNVSKVLIGVICVGLVFVLAVIAAAILIKRKKLNKRQHDVCSNTNTNKVEKTDSIPNTVEHNRIEYAAAAVTVDEERGHSQAIRLAEVDVSVCAEGSDPEIDQSLYANMTPGPDSRTINITHLGNYIATTPLDEVFKCFQEIPYGLIYPVEAARLVPNTSKNRYKDMCPYDHCRVVLQSYPNIPHSDYINASFINGYDGKNSYIAAGAPISSSVDDFWRMIWEQRIKTVVMVTNLVEAGKVKCLKYWPDVNQSFVYGGLTVTTADVECYADFTVKSFSVTCEELKKRREIKHYHFTSWPDKDVPEGSNGLAHFLQFVRKRDRGKTYPWLVHCSAGVGRTGTFIAIDILYTQGLHTGSVNVYQCVHDLRQQRVNMVQTKEQYRFIHEVLYELLTQPSKPVNKREYSTVYRQMTQQDPGMNDMELQYKQLKSGEQGSRWCCSRNESLRIVSLVTNNSVTLARTKTEQGYTFPAALYLPSYKHQRAFIVSPHPLEDELFAFIRLIVHERIRLIVTLDTEDKENSSVPPLFLSKQKSPSKYYKVAVDSVSQDKLYDTVTYNIKTGKETFQTSHVVYKDWQTGKAVPRSKDSLLHLLQLVENYRSDISYPILVLCSDGIDNSAFFCVLLSLLERANLEDEIALFQTIRHFRSKSRSIITSFEQFQCCHDIVQLYLQNDGTYANA